MTYFTCCLCGEDFKESEMNLLCTDPICLGCVSLADATAFNDPANHLNKEDESE